MCRISDTRIHVKPTNCPCVMIDIWISHLLTYLGAPYLHCFVPFADRALQLLYGLVAQACAKQRVFVARLKLSMHGGQTPLSACWSRIL